LILRVRTTLPDHPAGSTDADTMLPRMMSKNT
jgi:hypothetical protein